MRSSVVAPVARRPALERTIGEPLDVSLFGTLVIRSNGRVVPLRLPQQAVRLLAFLLLHRHARQSREHIAFSLWPDVEEADARANLRRKLHLLQRALPASSQPWIQTTPTSLFWNEGAPYKLDIADFESLSRADATLAQADALYRGDLLVDFDDEWIARERERLRTIATDNLFALVARFEKRRDFAQALRFGQRLLALDPWREDAVRTLIALRYEAGDRAGALSEYERFRSAIAAEMGVTPMPETVCVYERVLANAAAASPTSAPRETAALPRAAPGLPFVNRERELREMTTAWTNATSGAGSSVLVVGEAGIGKTRLIDRFATFVASNGGRVIRGGTTPFELAPYQPISEALRSALPILRETPIEPLWLAVLATLVPQVDVIFPGLPRLTALDAESERTRLFEAVGVVVEALCAARPMILILEDLHWAGSATIALFEHLARHAPLHRTLIVASYREDELSRSHPLRGLRRRLEREGLLRIAALGPLEIGPIAEIVDQFVRDEPEQRAAIARSLRDASDGNPFFLSEIVANDRESGVLDEAMHRWQRGEGATDLPAPLQSTLNARLGRLSLRARSIAEVAAVIGGTFSAELVREVTGVDERSTLDSLGELIDRRLVREIDAGTDFAFSHHLIQKTVYAEMPAEARQRRHRRVANVIEEMYAERIEEFAAEIAAQYDRGNEPETAAEYYCLAARHALGLYGSEEAKQLAERGNELAVDSATRFRAIGIIEEASRRLGDREAQQQSIEQLTALTECIDQPDMRREALRRQIVLAHDCGERDRERAAIAALEGQLTDARVPWPATFAQLKGSYLTAIGSYREARTVLSNALEQVCADDYPRIYVECWCALVELAGFEGRVADVRAFLDDVPTFERTYDMSQVVTLLETACAASMKIQDNAALARCADRLLDCSHASGYRGGEAAAYRFAGLAALRLFEIDRARASLGRALEMFSSMGQRLKKLQTLSDIASLTTTIGKYDEAIEQLQVADAIAVSISYDFGHVACVNNISYVAYLKGDFELARSAAQQALEAAQRIEAPSALAHTLVSIGVAERELHDLDAAVAHLEEGTALERALNENLGLAEDLCELIIALLRQNRHERAVVLSAEVLALAENPAQRNARPQYLFWTLAAVRRASGDDSGAQAMLTRARTALDDLEAAISDADSRCTFRSLRSNKAIDDAFENNHWKI